MIRHLVLFRLAPEPAAVRIEHIEGMRARLQALQAKVSGALSIEVDPDVVGGPNHWHVALVAEFEDRAALDAYQAHPNHQAAIAYLADFVVERSIVDTQINGLVPAHGATTG